MSTVTFSVISPDDPTTSETIVVDTVNCAYAKAVSWGGSTPFGYLLSNEDGTKRCVPFSAILTLDLPSDLPATFWDM
jgi:hypothetical protein